MSLTMVGYVTALLAFVCGVQLAGEASGYCDLGSITFCDFTAFSFFSRKTQGFVVWGVPYKEYRVQKLLLLF